MRDWQASPDSLAGLQGYRAAVAAVLADLEAEQVVPRIWSHDYRVWSDKPHDIANRLGWLHSPELMSRRLPELQQFVGAVRADGYDQALLLGMGGSSLAPEVFSKTFGTSGSPLHLEVLDSTDPGVVLSHQRRLNPARTLFIVSTKSGDTVETLAGFRFFYNHVVQTLGEEEAGKHFVAITDPGSGLQRLAARYRFRTVFLNPRNIGGRYSVFSYFGLVPAALVGIDLGSLLARARAMARRCRRTKMEDNPGACLGAILGEMAQVGRDKLTLIMSPTIAPFGAWVEQLVAESTGKDGKGILPVDGEHLCEPQRYGDDRLFVYLRLHDEGGYDDRMQALAEAGHPVVRLDLKDRDDLGSEFFRWEFATAVAGRVMGVHPFNQPNVEAAKTKAREMVRAYQETGVLPAPPPLLQDGGIVVYGEQAAATAAEALHVFLAQGKPGDYIALHGYLQPTSPIDAALQELRYALLQRTGLATTLGYGPRFLHSTGQLFKGDRGNGLFIQLTAYDQEEAPIPDQAGLSSSSISFRVLKASQALGDREAMLEVGRRVICFHLGDDVLGGLRRLIEAV